MPSYPTHATPFPERQDAELLTIEDVAEILRTPVNTMRWWRQIGRGPQFFTIGRRLYIEVGDLRVFIRKQREAAKPLIPRPTQKD
ncbi:MAG: helix-turn-helix domain-containing protein [Nocardioides sp.]|uniref:helix-turn-helix domain-containing protein n=1 Tax=Nocardioides sp. TaxID=35761 RepID=UPI0032677B4A